MAIVRVHNKVRNITCVYESESYWDKELKQPRSHRKLIGRIDPEMVAVIPTGRKGKLGPAIANNSDTDYIALYEQALATIGQKDTLIQERHSHINPLEAENRTFRHSIGKACDILTDAVPRKERRHG